MYRNDEHKEVFEGLLKRKPAMTKKEQSILFLLTSIPVVASNLDKFYEFIPFADAEGYINLEGFNAFSLSTGEKKVVEVAFNLYNGYHSGTDISLYGLKCSLDARLFGVYVEALNKLVA